MALFQNSVLNKYIKLQDQQAVEKAFKKHAKYFHNSERQQNIRDSKEEQFQEGFLRELFVYVLGYILKPEPNFNLTTELKNEKNAKKTDGAILKNGQALAVIELKSTKTKNLESIRQQAFDYKANQTGCVYVITSNFEKIRFYINNAVDFEEFNLFTLNLEQFTLMYLCLHQSNLLNNIPLIIKTASVVEEEKITKIFYNDYSLFKRELFRDLVKQNIKNQVFCNEIKKEDSEQANKNIKFALFKTSQKLIDRFLFIFFSEDRGLLPPNSTLQILKKWKADVDFGDVRPLYNLFKTYFHFLDTGRKGTDSRAEIFAYNGGLFKSDPILDSLLIDDELLYKHTKQLSDYNFESQLDVNILGHIFENSLNEIESVNAEIEGTDFDKQKTKRKKDGVFYTPKYITKYIVDNTIGKLCTEKKDELNILEEDFNPKRQKETKKKLLGSLEIYREWLLQLTICDPACGSGAFLNQALDFLIKEHEDIDELQTTLLGGGFVFPNIENTVLENNIFGVDLNEESVEIAKLSLWLRTAQPRRKLNTLNNNIKCGNSLIDDPKVAGDKAFSWEKEFPQVFKEKKKKAWHITTATHNSRYSKRMFDNYVKLGEPVWLDEKDEILITKIIAEIVKNDKLNVIEYNICGDHMHLLLVCEKEEVPKIVGKLKAMTSRAVNIASGKTVVANHATKGHAPLSASMANTPLSASVANSKKKRGETQTKLWTQKFNSSEIKDEKYLNNTIAYIQNNRIKHELPKNKAIEKLKKDFLCTKEHAFRTEYNGGFDVIIGNPPYVKRQNISDENQILFLENKYQSATYNFDLYLLFIEKGSHLINKIGLVSYINPSKFTSTKTGEGLRNYLDSNCHILSYIDFKEYQVFADVTTYCCIFILNNKSKANTMYYELNENTPQEIDSFPKYEIEIKDTASGLGWQFKPTIEIKGTEHLKDFVQTITGIESGADNLYILEKDNSTIEKFKPHFGKIIFPVIKGTNVYRYYFEDSPYYGIIPYSEDKKLLNPEFIENKYPEVWNYLNEHKEALQSREKGKMNTPNWYGYVYPKNLYKYSNKRLIWTDISIKPQFVIDETKSWHVRTVCSLELNKKGINKGLSLKFLLSILNSNLFFYFIKNNSNSVRGGYLRYKPQYVKEFPLPDVIDDSLIVKLENTVTNVIEITKNYVLSKVNFQKYVQSQFKLGVLSKKLQNWHELDFATFIKELNKVIKKVGGEKLTKTDEMDWMDVFETKKAAAQTLKTEIDKTDKEIDQMVYTLYGLSEEKIKIVEGSN